MKKLWISNVKTDTHYSPVLISAFFVSYILIWLASVYLNGGYDKPYKATRIMRGMLIGGIITLAAYGLLSEELRFSRGITVLGALSGTLLILLSRVVMKYLRMKQVQEEDTNKQVIIIGTGQEENEIRTLLEQAHIEKKLIGSVSPLDVKEHFQLGIFSQLIPLGKLYKANEMIFAQGQLSFKQIIDSMQAGGAALEYKIHSMGTGSIIGSNSKNTAGDLYTTELTYKITTASAKRNKRVIDIVFSLFFILSSPICFWFARHKGSYFLNMFLILEGDKTFVGYDDTQFPALRPHILNVYPAIDDFEIPADNKEHLDWLYAKNYSGWDDVEIILKKWRGMGG
jgi:hypothetical protein